MTPRFTSSKPDPWVSPRQSRYDQWGHGPIQSDTTWRDIIRDARSCGERPVLGFVLTAAAFLVIAAFGAML